MASTQWIVDAFAAALAQLTSALAEPAERDLIKAGTIQYFEFSFELGWKACKVVSAAQGLPDSPKPAYTWHSPRAGWTKKRHGWKCSMREIAWRTYDARKALQIYESLPQFCVALQKFLATLQSSSRN